MSDLEQELAGALALAAEDAPGVTGLADAARRRHRVRRQRRVAVGGALVALVVGLGGLALRSGDDGVDVVKDPVDGTPPGWQTIRSGEALASVPSDWVAYDCPSGDADSAPVYGPPDGDSCADGVGAVFLPSARDLGAPGALVGTDGGVLGNVGIRTTVLRVFHPDEALVRQILATARGEGQPVIDGSRWVSFERDGMSYEVPAWWGLGEDGDRDGYSVCLYPPDSDKESHSDLGEGYAFGSSPRRQGLVVVEAPTQAVAELVLATVRLAKDARPSEECTSEDFSTGLLPGESTPGAGTPVEDGERTVDLPTNGWQPGDPSLKARIGGLVTLSGDRCVVLASASAPIAFTYVSWPAGYTASIDEAGALTLHGPDGQVVARQGDRIEAGGGYGDERAGTHPCLPEGEEDIASVMSEVTVVP